MSGSTVLFPSCKVFSGRCFPIFKLDFIVTSEKNVGSKRFQIPLL